MGQELVEVVAYARRVWGEGVRSSQALTALVIWLAEVGGQGAGERRDGIINDRQDFHLLRACILVHRHHGL